MAKKYALPTFLTDIVSQAAYEDWLYKKAQAHVKRDRKRGNPTAIGEAYRVNIHNAILASNGRDYYTGETLEWHLIGTYNNETSSAKRREYKATLALLPTVDHVGDGLGVADFKICSWRTNSAKNDLSHPEFIALCKRVVEYHS